MKFSKDIWCSESSMSISCLSLFVIATSKDSWVIDVYRKNHTGGCWRYCHLRQFHVIELCSVEALLMSLQERSTMRNSMDRLKLMDLNESRVLCLGRGSSKDF